jgi:hypothetical protein
MSEVTFGEISYRIDRINALDAFDIAVRLGPMALTLSQELRAGVTKVDGARMIYSIVSGVAAQIAKPDWDYIKMVCLAAVHRRDPANGLWFPLAANGRLMYENGLDVGTLMELIERVLEENLQSFFANIRSGSAATDEPTSVALSSNS